MSQFSNLQVGDKVTRWLCGTIEIPLTVTEITNGEIICGAWRFDKTNGFEIDEDISHTVSFLTIGR
jgi:hypothetical protein